MSIQHRGPDNHVFTNITDCVYLGFHRLAITDNTVKGNQPFTYEDDTHVIYCICNGEIYNYKHLIDKYKLKGLISHSDCEVLIPMYGLLGSDFINELDGEFAFIIFEYNKSTKVHKIVVGRDIVGVRPLFIGRIDGNQGIMLASEAKGLAYCHYVEPFLPATIMEATYADKNDVSCADKQYFSYPIADKQYFSYPIASTNKPCINMINQLLTDAVEKRLHCDREIGCLLSGGLDSSLVCGIANKLMKDGKKLTAFTVTLDENGPDITNARLVAAHVGCPLVEVKITRAEALAAIPTVIAAIESYDVTTVRASTMQYLLGKYIKENTDVKVLLSGELADELLQGYLYFHKAPDAHAAFEESIRLVKDVYLFDGLRTDRTLAANGLEVRLPFTDRALIEYVYGIKPEYLQPQKGIEKYLLRMSFASDNIIPTQVLFRKKDAFSDAVSNVDDSWHNTIKQHVSKLNMTEQEWYLSVFSTCVGRKNLIPYAWMPKWTSCDDPSARNLDL